MNGERHIPNPFIEGFIRDIRTPGKKDPYIEQREGEAKQIMDHLTDLRLEHDDLVTRFPQLDINPNDQFALTPFDEFADLELIIPPEVHMRSWEIQREENLTIANHPARIFAMNELEQRGFVPPKKVRRPVGKNRRPIDRARKNGEIVNLSDLGQSRQLRLTRKESRHPQVHRTPFLAVGPLSFMGDRVRSFVGVGAMSDITGSILAGVTLSKMHVLWHVPKDGIYSDPKKQVDFVSSIISELRNPDDPLLKYYPIEERERIIDRWISCMVVSTEADPDKALRRFELAFNAGARSARPYQHTGGIEVVKTTSDLKKNFPEAEIFSSQISSEYIAQACEDAGASAGILGVGSGGRCITAKMAALIPTNAHLAWQLRGKLHRMPIMAEGGAINNPVVSALVGMSGVLGSGSLGGGTFEAPGGMFFFTKDGGKTLIKLYRGEASEAFKYLGGKTYPSGSPFFKEGDGTYREFDPFVPSITSKIRNAWQTVIVGASDLGLNGNDPDVIGQIHRLKRSPLERITQEGTKSQNTHSSS